VSLIQQPSEFAQSEGVANRSRPQFDDQATPGARHRRDDVCLLEHLF